MANTMGDQLNDEVMENGVNAMIDLANSIEEDYELRVSELEEKISEQDEQIKDLYARLN